MLKRKCALSPRLVKIVAGVSFVLALGAVCTGPFQQQDVRLSVVDSYEESVINERARVFDATQFDADFAAVAEQVIRSIPRSWPSAVVKQDGEHEESDIVQQEAEVEENSKTCIIAVASSIRLLQTLSLAALHTWVPETERVCDVRFFVGRGELAYTDREPFGNRLVQLDVEDEYPPLEKVFGLWDYLSRNMRNYKFFAKVDADTYVNSGHVRALLFNRLPKMGPMNYFGTLGLGLPEDRPVLGITRAYCLGMGYFFSRAALESVGPRFLGECISDIKTNHSDTEVGRCVDRFLDVSCEYSPIPVVNMYWHVPDNTIHGMEWSATKQLDMDFSAAPPTSTYTAVFVHPFKSVAALSRFHQQVKHNIRPPITTFRCHASMDKWDCQMAQQEISSSCVHSPSAQLELTGGAHYLPECPPPAPTVIPTLNVPVFVLSLDSDEGAKAYNEAKFLLQSAGMHNISRFIGTNGREKFADATGPLKPGELGYRETMRRLFAHALSENLERIVVVDDDAKPHKRFRQVYNAVMNDQRCGAHMWTEHEGGVLMLGGTVWSNGTYPRYNKEWYGGWTMIDDDRRNASRVVKIPAPGRKGKVRNRRVLPMCYNANRFSVGSFAGMYHRSVYASMLEWLESEDPKHHKPYDHVLSYLGEMGHIVRVAFPNLFVPDVDHRSSVDPNRTSMGLAQRAPIHRWKVEDYCWNRAC